MGNKGAFIRFKGSDMVSCTQGVGGSRLTQTRLAKFGRSALVGAAADV